MKNIGKIRNFSMDILNGLSGLTDCIKMSDNKRIGIPNDNTVSKRKKVEESSYSGYVPSIDGETITQVSLSDLDSKSFYENYIRPRKPVLINGVIDGFDVNALKSNAIVDSLEKDGGGHFFVQIEHKVQGGFGAGNSRLKIKFDDFIKQAKNGEQSAYLTTQYDEEDEDEDSEEDEEDENVFNNGVGEEEDEEDDEDIASEIPKGSFDKKNNDSNSDADSIDFNDLHDDFEDLNSEDDENEDVGDYKPIATVKNVPLFLIEAKERLYDLVQRPLTCLVAKKKLPVIPDLFKNLVPQQINIWIGSVSKEEKPYSFIVDENKPDFGLGRGVPGNGTSSGLHHDHADNLYIPIQGKKRFTIFAPLDARSLSTVGDVHKIFNSGVIDYETNEKAPKWKHVRSDGATIETDAETGSPSAKTKEKLDPPSFCKIPPVLLHTDELNGEQQKQLTFIQKTHYSELSAAKRITVKIEAGQMLYLPTGWFHEVTSFADTEEQLHIAINYWFYPVDGDKYEKPYKDPYWPDDFERTKKSCELYQDGAFDLSEDY